MWTKSKSLTLSRVLTDLFLLALCASAAMLDQIIHWYFRVTGRSDELFAQLFMVLLSSILPALIAFVCLHLLLRNIARGQVFVRANVKLLRLISWCCFSFAVIYAVYCFTYVLAVIVALAAAFVGLVVRVVKNVVAEAIALKEENELTV